MISIQRLRCAAVAVALVTASLAANPGHADEAQWRHGLSLFGELKYPAGFKRFDYVNPNAPKGGAVRQIASGTYDNFNPVIAFVKGNAAAGVDLVFDTLMVSPLDEVSTEYGLIAEAVSHPDDFSWVKYRLRPEAKWHDGKPVTPEDVIFSLEAFKKHSPQHSAYYRHVTKAEKTGDHEVDLHLRFGRQPRASADRRPAHRAAETLVGRNRQGRPQARHRDDHARAAARRRRLSHQGIRTRPLDYLRARQGLLGQGPQCEYRPRQFRRAQAEYFRDLTVALEAFKADQVDWRSENSAKNWATAYDFPAVRDKRVLLEEFPVRNLGVMQAFAFNTRREKFQDPRVRRAFNYAFDFEEMNKALFFGQYVRIDSYFKGTELAWNWRPEGEGGDVTPDAQPASASGLPEGQELAILETVRDQVPPEVFTTPFKNPAGGANAMRTNLREALRLFKEAGWEVRDQKLVNAKTGEQMTVEILLSEPTFERVALFLKPTLERLGIAMTVRTVDDSQYENRLRSWDYDVVVASWGQSLSPGNEQRFYWGSQSADQSGSRNYVGIKNPAIDKLIDRIIFAKDRAELIAATRAMDRVLMWNHYVIPQWTYGKTRTARWDRFGRPEKLPPYGASAFPTIWWWDAERAAKVGAR